MGINDSMDSFNISTDCIVEGINKTLKSVDDVLGQGRDPQEIYLQIREVLKRIINKKFKLSRKKFHIGTQIDFGGYIIKSTKIESQNDQNNNLEVTICPFQNFPIPKTKVELMSFLGLVKTLNTYTP